MSAWDVAGAVVWTITALVCWGGSWQAAKDNDTGTSGVGFILAVPTTAAAAYCVARLCGAHA